MGISEIHGRAVIELDGRISSVATKCVEPQHNRCASVYVIEAENRSRKTYVAGPTDQSLRRDLPAGTYIQKRKWELGYRIDGTPIEDFPIVFYSGILALSIGCFAWWFWLYKHANA